MANVAYDAELLGKLHTECGAVMCLGTFPKGSEFGIDCMSWTVGPKFAGVKLIPPGVHYIHWSTAATSEIGDNDKEPHRRDDEERTGGLEGTGDAGESYENPFVNRSLAPRCGKFLHIARNSVIVLRWDNQIEEFLPINEDEAARYAIGVRNLEFDDKLGPYPLDSYEQWLRLSSNITSKTTERLAPVGSGTISMAKLSSSSTQDSKDYSVESHPSKEFYCPLPGRRPKDRSGVTFSAANITKYAFDRSQALMEVLMGLSTRLSERQLYLDGHLRNSSEDGSKMPKEVCEAELIGELQFAFVTFLVGQSADGFEHWKGLVDLICRSEDAILGNPVDVGTINKTISKNRAASDRGISTREEGEDLPSPWFFETFINVLRLQLFEVPEDFFVDIISNGNFMHHALRSLMGILDINGETNSVPNDTKSSLVRVVSAGLKLRKFVEKRFMWRVTEDLPNSISSRLQSLSVANSSRSDFNDTAVNLATSGSVFGFTEDDDGPTIVDLNAVMF